MNVFESYGLAVESGRAGSEVFVIFGVLREAAVKITVRASSHIPSGKSRLALAILARQAATEMAKILTLLTDSYN